MLLPGREYSCLLLVWLAVRGARPYGLFFRLQAISIDFHVEAQASCKFRVNHAASSRRSLEGQPGPASHMPLQGIAGYRLSLPKRLSSPTARAFAGDAKSQLQHGLGRPGGPRQRSYLAGKLYGLGSVIIRSKCARARIG